MRIDAGVRAAVIGVSKVGVLPPDRIVFCVAMEVLGNPPSIFIDYVNKSRPVTDPCLMSVLILITAVHEFELAIVALYIAIGCENMLVIPSDNGRDLRLC
ncbi:hypothetical protein AB6A40_008302 [Gnathostoma spinigerum]|uniref:Uncharacterized protein n=1 Tax=Gnathostoma spinigerum TaxID=75299 RepID=A0ABD6ENP8_9BILA